MELVLNDIAKQMRIANAIKVLGDLYKAGGITVWDYTEKLKEILDEI